jgi:hypothetical protein
MMFLQIAGALASAAFGYLGAREQREQAKKDQDKQFVRMRNAAQRAGFNPLTVLRATGGQGFTGLPVLSKAAAFGNAVTGIFDAYRREPIERYKADLRKLDIKQRVMDLYNTGIQGKLMKAQIANLGSKNDERVYLYEDDGSPKKNIFGQHVYIDEQAAAVFPTLQGYMDMQGNLLVLPHEQLLDMNVASLPTAVAAIEGGIAASKQQMPTIFKFPMVNAYDRSVRGIQAQLSFGRLIDWRE